MKQGEMLSTKVIEDDIKNGVEDEYGVVYSKDGKILLKCRNLKLKTYTIKDDTIIIAERAFAGRKSLQHVTISGSVTVIGNGAFEDCSNLQDAIIPNSVSKIGAYVFAKCVNLKDVLISNTVKTIECSTFAFCRKLEHITIPNSVIEIDNNAFLQCLSLKQVNIPNSVKKIGANAFAYCKSLQQSLLPESISEISDNTFFKCESLQQIIIPNSIVAIGNNAFYGCKSLKKLVIPNSISKIGKNIISDCIFLDQTIIPEKFRPKRRIVKIKIHNFRAFQDEEITFDNFNCIIGKNDSGKSTIIAALEWFFNPNKQLTENDFAIAGLKYTTKSEKVNYKQSNSNDTVCIYQYDDCYISVEIYFSGVVIPVNSEKYNFIYEKDFLNSDDCVCIKKYMFHPLSKKQDKRNGYSIKIYPFQNTMCGKIFSDFSFNEIEKILRKNVKNKSKFEKKQSGITYWDQIYISQFKFQIYENLHNAFLQKGYKIVDNQWMNFDAEQSVPFRLDLLDSYNFIIYTSNTPISAYLNNLFNPYNAKKIFDPIKDEKKRTANNLAVMLQKNNVSECLEFKESEPINLFSEESIVFKKDNLPISIPLKNRGEGLQLTIKKVVFEMLANQKSQNKNTFITFEEPETHLHPSAQIEMYKTIKALSENPNYQVFMTTHSPYIVNELSKDSNNNIIIVERNVQKNESYINKTVKKRVLPYGSMNEINYIAFDEPSIAYHQELYCYMQNKLDKKVKELNQWLDRWLTSISDSQRYDWYDTDELEKTLPSYSGRRAPDTTKLPERATLPYCVRNCIDHSIQGKTYPSYPNAVSTNSVYSSIDKILESIKIMREAIQGNPINFPTIV